jgi:RasGEF family protein
VGLRRLRKGLLSDLSLLVRIAKQLQDTVQNGEIENIVYELLDELILKAFKVVERAVRFHDIWNQDVEGGNALEYSAPNNRPPTPPVDLSSDTQSSSGAEQGRESLEEDRSAMPRESMQKPDNDEIKQVTNHLQNEVETSSPRRQSIQEAPVPSQLASRPLSISANRISVSHRLSYIGKGSAAQRDNLASERLSAAYDSFTSLLGIFLGLHIKSRSSHELAATTHRSVVACRQLIAVVEEIWARDGRQQDSLQAARDVMYARLAEIVKTTKDMLTTAQNDDILDPDHGQQLVLTTTSCIRAAGDCVSKARQTIERIGDFEFEANGIAFSDQILAALPETHTSQPSLSGSESFSINRSGSTREKPLPTPPEPTSRPPPPPQLSLSIDAKPLPEPPRLSPIVSPDSTLQSILLDSPDTGYSQSSESSLPPQSIAVPLEPSKDVNFAIGQAISPAVYSHLPRVDSVNASVSSVTDTNSTWRNSVPESAASVVSHTSTRATTPEHSPIQPQEGVVINRSGSVSEIQSLTSEESIVEEHVLETTYAHELIPSKDGQVLGGSLPALIERLTAHDSTPDVTFVTTFYLTFRLFTTPMEFAQGLVDRFEYIGHSSTVGLPVRLRIYNVFKQWLETHWQPDTDCEVLPLISDFANKKLAVVLVSAATRLLELITKVSERGDRAICPRIVSALGKTSTSVTSFSSIDIQIPTPNVSKSQLNALRATKVGGPPCTVLDFDPLELARQFTIIESRIFCSIAPEELLANEWTKKADSRAVNVRAMSTLSTDLANLVADSILQFEEPKKRSTIIKQWVKIAMKCLELNNYDSLMAIICSLNSSMILRLKKTWDLVSQKTKTRLEELGAIVDVGKNYHVLRERLKDLVAPCIPFVGLYLTDLTFVHAGNPEERELPGVEPKRFVINFDRYTKTAKTIGQLQRFQVPYRLAAIPEMQEWMEGLIQRIRDSDSANVQSYYRRSLFLEPRENQGNQPKSYWQSTQSSNSSNPQPQYQAHQYQSQPQYQSHPQFQQPQSQYQGKPQYLAQQGVQQPNNDSLGYLERHSSKESVGGMSGRERFDLFGSFSSSRSSDTKVGSPDSN